ncbi:hypothetical protein SCARD494_02731 [Seiridium cardinale]
MAPSNQYSDDPVTCMAPLASFRHRNRTRFLGDYLYYGHKYPFIVQSRTALRLAGQVRRLH